MLAGPGGGARERENAPCHDPTEVRAIQERNKDERGSFCEYMGHECLKCTYANCMSLHVLHWCSHMARGGGGDITGTSLGQVFTRPSF